MKRISPRPNQQIIEVVDSGDCCVEMTVFRMHADWRTTRPVVRVWLELPNCAEHARFLNKMCRWQLAAILPIH